MITAGALAPIAVPIDALRQHAAVIGRTGSGKTYAAKGLVEHLLALGRRVVILDPTGAWWGLLSTADGRGEGFPVTVFGGDHAHVAITEHAGHAVADLVGSGNVPAVVDLSGTTLGERHRFVERFAETLFRVNRGPLHLVIDEADEFAPQAGPPGTERMLGAIDRIVRRGRIKGFRVLMITQRPAVLNKNVLTQANTLVAMRLPASQDRKAVEAWVKGQADEALAGRLLGSLSGLKLGEGWVWAPELGMLEQKTFPRNATFDSSRTPDDGEAIEAPRKLADVDLSAVRDAMAEAVRHAEENDVTLLKKRVAELQARVNAAANAAPAAPAAGVEARIAEASARALEPVRAALTIPAATVNSVRSGLEAALAQIGSLAVELRAVHDAAYLEPAAPLNGHVAAHRPAPPAPRPFREPRPRAAATDRAARDALTGPQRRLLDSIAAWNDMGVDRPSVAQAGLFAGYAPTSGTFDNLRGACRSLGLIDYPEPGLLMLTPAGTGVVERGGAPGLAEMHARIREPLSGPERKLFDVLVAHGGEPLAVSSAAELAGYAATSGTFDNLRGRLRTLGLATYPRRTTIAAAAWLFPESVR